MATSGPTSLPAFHSTDSDFRTWVSGVISAITAVGNVQSTDTGQINTSTVLKPTAINTVAGYAIFRFNDSLQSTSPIFYKVEFGSGAVVGRPSIWITAGVSTDGAGTIVNQIGTRTQRAMGVTKTAGTTLPSYVSGTSSRIHAFIAFDTGNSSSNMGFFIERTKDASGTETGDGFLCMVYVNTFQIIPATGVVPGTAATGGPCMPVSAGSRSSSGTDVAISHGIAYLGKPFYFYLVSGVSTDLPAATSTFTATVLSASHTYIVTNNTAGNFAYGTPNTEACCFLWE